MLQAAWVGFFVVILGYRGLCLELGLVSQFDSSGIVTLVGSSLRLFQKLFGVTPDPVIGLGCLDGTVGTGDGRSCFRAGLGSTSRISFGP